MQCEFIAAVIETSQFADYLRSLAELFYYLVCAKVANHHKGWTRKQPKESRPSDSDYHPNSGEPGDSGDHDASTWENFTEEGDVDIPSALTTVTDESQNQGSVPQSASRQRMPPNIAPVAHMSSDQRSPGNLATERNAVTSDYVRPMRPMKQKKRRNNDHLNQVDGSSDAAYTYTPRPSLGGLPFPKSSEARSASLNPVGYSQAPSTLRTKRPMAESLDEPSNKRSRISPSVIVPKPSLIVTLKLTAEQGALLNRGKAAPPQPSYDPLHSPDLPDIDEIVARMPASLVDQQVDPTESGNWPRQDNYQPPSVQSEELSDRARDTEGAEDTSHVPTRVEPTQTVPEAAPFPDDTTETTIATQRQSYVVTKEQATAEFWRLCSVDAQPICDQILSNVLDRMSAETAMQCVLPRLKQTRDVMSSSNAQSDLLSMSEQAQRSFTEQMSGLQRQEHTAPDDSDGPADANSSVQPIGATVSPSNIGGSDLAGAETVNRTDNVGMQSEQARPALPAAAQSIEKMREATVDDMRSDAQQTNPTPGLTTHAPASEPAGLSGKLSDAEFNRLIIDIDMAVRITRGDGVELAEGITRGIKDIGNDTDCFAILQHDYGCLLNPDEYFSRATVVQAEDPRIERTKIAATLFHASREGRSWEPMIEKIRTIYEKGGADIKMDLVADVLVTKRRNVES